MDIWWIVHVHYFYKRDMVYCTLFYKGGNFLAACLLHTKPFLKIVLN